MPVLTSDFRRQLENVIVEARDKAEAAARAALQKLGVDAAKPHEHFGPTDKALRNRLRARGRQAGDRRSENGTQEIEQLTQELAYEYWHRMLFARFLAENHLLMHPDGVAVSLDECAELAPTADPPAPNGFVLAARYAGRMLPQIFRTDDVLLEVEFPANDRLPLEKLLAGLPAQTFTADDSLGWVYQFWQSKRKDEVNAKGDKIDARSLPAVTQLFTEHYMVLFLLHNTVGAWHAGKALAANPKLGESAASEEEVRKAVTLDAADGYNFDYLRFIRGVDGTGGPWRPAAGTFDGWPKKAAELKLLDPCCGSGHFLVAGFDLLVRLRMAEESLDVTEAIDAVLRDNLHGLELDPRCTQIAAFNLAVAAWKLGGYRALPPLNIACTGVGPQGKKDDWLNLADAATLRERGPIRYGLGLLYDTFIDAPTLGSLIDPKAVIGTLGAADYDTIAPVLAAAVKATERPDINGGGTVDAHADAVTAQGLLKAAELLAGPDEGYTLVITNVPYLGRGKQDGKLQAWADENAPNAKADLATIFVSRSFRWVAGCGSVAVVSPQNWLFLKAYRDMRRSLATQVTFRLLANLGEEAWESFGIRGPRTTLLIAESVQSLGVHSFLSIEATTPRGDRVIDRREKQQILKSGSEHWQVLRHDVSAHDPIAIAATSLAAGKLGDVARVFQGVGTADASRFITRFWEVLLPSDIWEFYHMAPERGGAVSGCHATLRWEGGKGALALSSQARVCGQPAWSRDGFAICVGGTLPRSRYFGQKFDCTAGVLIPSKQEALPAIGCFLESEDFPRLVRAVDPAFSVTERSFEKVPFDLAHWQQIAVEKYPDGLPEPESDDPTQWLFHGRPEASESPLQVAVARLAAYRWPAELDESMRLSERARGLVKRCDDLLRFTDDDGILPIPAMYEEPPLAERLTYLLAAAYDKNWSPAVIHKLLADAGMKAGASFDDWLRNAFFEQHCRLFHHRPFIWHIWDGRKDGFNVLVNYHKLDFKRLDGLTHAYLGDWITTQAADAKAGKTGADLRLAAAQALQKKLEVILAGEKPYDVFVRWKPLKDQPIGWNPDLNDGVRMNIRPFVIADVLRKTPNIKWLKDRGKDPETAPWFNMFKGERINDYHLSLAEKHAATEGRKS